MTAVVVITPDELRALIREEVEGAIAALVEEARGPEGLLTNQELARRLSVSVRTVYALRGRGMPAIVVGDSARYNWSDVVSWLKERQSGTTDGSKEETED